VRFDENGDSAGALGIFNVQNDQFIPIATISGDNATFEPNTSVKFTGGTSVLPSDSPEAVLTYFDNLYADPFFLIGVCLYFLFVCLFVCLYVAFGFFCFLLIILFIIFLITLFRSRYLGVAFAASSLAVLSCFFFFAILMKNYKSPAFLAASPFYLVYFILHAFSLLRSKLFVRPLFLLRPSCSSE